MAYGNSAVQTGSAFMNSFMQSYNKSMAMQADIMRFKQDEKRYQEGRAFQREKFEYEKGRDILRYGTGEPRASERAWEIEAPSGIGTPAQDVSGTDTQGLRIGQQKSMRQVGVRGLDVTPEGKTFISVANQPPGIYGYPPKKSKFGYAVADLTKEPITKQSELSRDDIGFYTKRGYTSEEADAILDKRFGLKTGQPETVEDLSKELSRWQTILNKTREVGPMGTWGAISDKETHSQAQEVITELGQKISDIRSSYSEDYLEQERRDKAHLPLSGPHKRPDGSLTGPGWLGTQPSVDGMVNTEISFGVQIDGKETDIPALVPGLSEEQLNYLQTTPENQLFQTNPEMWNSIQNVAIPFAKNRISQGLSPFKELSEPQSEEEFLNIVQGMKDDTEAKAYYDKWVSKWQ